MTTTSRAQVRPADSDLSRILGDCTHSYIGAKSTALNLVKSLKADGVPIDGVGIQSHLIVGEVPSTFQQNLEEFVALGVEVAITELDIRFQSLPPDAAGIAQQKQDYETVVAACNAVEKCVRG